MHRAHRAQLPVPFVRNVGKIGPVEDAVRVPAEDVHVGLALEVPAHNHGGVQVQVRMRRQHRLESGRVVEPEVRNDGDGVRMPVERAPQPGSAGSGPQWITTGFRQRAEARHTASSRGSSGAIFITWEWIFTPRNGPESACSRMSSAPSSPGKTVQQGKTSGWRLDTSSVKSLRARARPGLWT